MRCQHPQAPPAGVETHGLRIYDPVRADHLIESSVRDERCICCGEPSAHVIAEIISDSTATTTTNYLCCRHFSFIFGNCYASANSRPDAAA